MGFVDTAFLNGLRKLGYKVPKGLVDDLHQQANKSSTPTAGQYEFAASKGRAISEHLNSIKWQGRPDWKPHQVQAVGWMSILGLLTDSRRGVSVTSDSDTALSRNQARISMEVRPSETSALFAEVGEEYDTLSREGQQGVTQRLARRAIEIAERETGADVSSVTYGDGGYQTDINQAAVIERPITLDTAEAAANVLGLALTQDEVWAHTTKPITANPKAFALDIIETTGSENQLSRESGLQNVWTRLTEADTRGEIQGFMPITSKEGRRGIRVLVPMGGKARQKRLAQALTGARDALQEQGLFYDTWMHEAEIRVASNDWSANAEGQGYRDNVRRLLGRDSDTDWDNLRSELAEELRAAIRDSSGRSGRGAEVGVRRDAWSPPTRSDGRIPLSHFAGQRRRVIDPARHGTGPVRGAERQRRADTGWVDRAYYGIAPGEQGGYRKEGGLGNVEHRTSVDPSELYDFVRDPDGLRVAGDLSASERAIRDAGYKGYWVSNPEIGGVAAVFEKLKLEKPPKPLSKINVSLKVDIEGTQGETALVRMPANEALVLVNKRLDGLAKLLGCVTS
jgi:hypothetical protein